MHAIPTPFAQLLGYARRSCPLLFMNISSTRLMRFISSVVLFSAPVLAQDNITAGFHKFRQAAEQNWAVDGVVGALVVGGLAWGFGATGHRDVAHRLGVAATVTLGAGTIMQWLR